MKPNAVARVASLIGEPARTAMLLQLMDGRAMTAKEMAQAAGVSAATGSRHLALMVQAGLLQVTTSGRHRYHRLGSPQVAQLMESVMQIAGTQASTQAAGRTGPRDESMRQARSCYDHIAGRLGVAIADKLVADGAVVIDADTGVVTPHAGASLQRLGLALADDSGARAASRRVLCRPCMDWSERRFHLAGRLGALICVGCLRQGWLQRMPRSRALQITPPGQLALRHWMGWELWQTVAP